MEDVLNLKVKELEREAQLKIEEVKRTELEKRTQMTE